MARPLLIFGIGPMVEQAHYYFTQHAGRQVDAFTVEAAFLTTDHFAGLPVLPFDEAQRRFPPDTHDLFVAIGYTQFNQVRKRIFLQAQALGYTLPSFVHETAVIARNVVVGANWLVRELAVIQPFASLGDNVSIGVLAAVSHHVRIGSHSFLSGGVAVNGRAVVGEACFLGSRCVVRDAVHIGDRCVLGAGAIILHDCPADGVYAATSTPRRVRT